MKYNNSNKKNWTKPAGPNSRNGTDFCMVKIDMTAIFCSVFRSLDNIPLKIYMF